MKPTTAPFVVGFVGGVLAILLAVNITGPVFRAVEDGASSWLLPLLFLPLVIAALAIVGMVVLDHLLNREAPTAPPVPRWHTIDEELPQEHSATELQMMRFKGVDSSGAHFDQIRAALNTAAEAIALPTNVIPKQRNTDGLS